MVSINTEILGFIGTFLMMSAYVPQIIHIVKEHCSGGISRKAWLLWLVASILLLIHALTTSDKVFITLQIANLVAVIVILTLITIYGKRVCHSKEKFYKRKFKH